jgi:biofilm protein TabA
MPPNYDDRRALAGASPRRGLETREPLVIIDTIEHISVCKGINPNLDLGLDFLLSAPSATLEEGRHQIDGDRVYAILSSYLTHEKDAEHFEAHRRYIDIQSLLSGSELIYWAPLRLLTETQAYSEERDFSSLEGAERSALTIGAGTFAIFFPQDAHKPGCMLGGAEKVKKIVIKARVD